MTKALAALRALFAPPPAATMAKEELEDAERALLKAQSGREYADAMVSYHQRRISRLRALAPVVAANEDLTPNQMALRRAA